MALSQSQSYRGFSYLIMLKSFLIWTFTLTVCFLVIGFPIVILMTIIGALFAAVLQSIMPASAVLLVAGGLLGMIVMGILLSAAALTLKGIHPQEIEWLRWLHGEANPDHTTVYASCPLTCSTHT